MERNKFITLLLILSAAFIGTAKVQAQTVSKTIASQRAAAVFNRNMPASAKGQSATSVKPKLVYTSEKDGVTCFYVFNNPEGGFAIIGGDEHATQVLASSKTGSFNYDEIPDPVKMFLNSYTEKIVSASFANDPVPEKAKRAAGEGVVKGRVDIAPLIKTAWGQHAPYNYSTPKSGIYQCVTGCVATAAAQVLYYLQWPKADLTDTLTRTLNVVGATPVKLSTMFGTYNWTDSTHWKNKYSGTEATTDSAAINVANLMRDCGIMAQMQYGPTDSYADALGLRKFFKVIDIDAKSRCFDNTDGGISAWEDTLYNELLAKRPVIYAASDGNKGHCFICDGYNATDNTFHFNWGWDGLYQDIYCSLRPTPNMKAGTWTFDNNHKMVYGIQPKETVVAAKAVNIKNLPSLSKGMLTTTEYSYPKFTSSDTLQLDFGEGGIIYGGYKSDNIQFGVMLSRVSLESMAGGSHLIPSTAGMALDMDKIGTKRYVNISLDRVSEGIYMITPIFWIDRNGNGKFAGDGVWECIDLPESVHRPVIQIVPSAEVSSVKAVQAQEATSTDGKYLVSNQLRILKDNKQYDASGIENK